LGKVSAAPRMPCSRRRSRPLQASEIAGAAGTVEIALKGNVPNWKAGSGDRKTKKGGRLKAKFFRTDVFPPLFDANLETDEREVRKGSMQVGRLA